MVYSRYRKTYRRRSKTSRLSYVKGAKNAFALAKQAARDIWYLKGLVNSEMLHKDNTFTLGSNQSQIFSFVNIAQGDTVSGRTGNSILLRNLYIRGTIQINTSTLANTRCTFMLIKDKQQVGDTSPSITDVLSSSTDPDTLLTVGTAGRFKVKWRKSYALTPVAGGRNVVEFSKYWKIRDHVRYNGTADTDIQRNGYYLIVVTSEAVNFPTLVFNARTGYHDN